MVGVTVERNISEWEACTIHKRNFLGMGEIVAVVEY
jgi:hypothetical protein